MIEAIDLTVRRRGRTILESVCFDVRPGQVTGLLGGNTAGKSTLLRRMVQLESGGGRTLFNGRRFRSLRHPLREVGLVLEPACGDPDRSVRGYLRLVLATDPGAAAPSVELRPGDGLAAAEAGDVVAGGAVIAAPPGDRRRGLRGRSRVAERIDAVLDVVGLADERATKLGELTESMALRLAIAAALLGDPEALLLDCPDRDLEPEGIAWLGELLRTFTAQGRAALLSGSNTESLAAVADRILLLDHGRLVGTRTAAEVLRGPADAAVLVRSPHIVRFAGILAEAGAGNVRIDGACLEVRGMDRARVGDLAFRSRVPVYELTDRPPSSHPADVVLAACSSRPRVVVPLQAAAIRVTDTVRPVAPSAAVAPVAAVAGAESSAAADPDTQGTVTLLYTSAHNSPRVPAAELTQGGADVASPGVTSTPPAPTMGSARSDEAAGGTLAVIRTGRASEGMTPARTVSSALRAVAPAAARPDSERDSSVSSLRQKDGGR